MQQHTILLMRSKCFAEVTQKMLWEIVTTFSGKRSEQISMLQEALENKDDKGQKCCAQDVACFSAFSYAGGCSIIERSGAAGMQTNHADLINTCMLYARRLFVFSGA